MRLEAQGVREQGQRMGWVVLPGLGFSWFSKVRGARERPVSAGRGDCLGV